MIILVYGLSMNVL